MPLNFNTVYLLSTIPVGGLSEAVDIVMGPVFLEGGGLWLRIASETYGERVIYGEELQDNEDAYIFRAPTGNNVTDYAFMPLTRDWLMTISEEGTAGHKLALSVRNDADLQAFMWTDWMDDKLDLHGGEEGLVRALRAAYPSAPNNQTEEEIEEMKKIEAALEAARNGRSVPDALRWVLGRKTQK